MLSCFHELVVVGEKGEVCDCLVCFSFFVYNCGFFSSSQKWMISKFQRNMWSCFHGWKKRKSWRLFCLFFLFCLQLCFFSSSQKWMTSMFQRNMWSCFHVGGKGKVGDCFVCFSPRACCFCCCPQDTSLLPPTINQLRKVNNYQPTTNQGDE